MDRRTFIRTTTAAAVGASAVSANAQPHQAAAPHKLAAPPVHASERVISFAIPNGDLDNPAVDRAHRLAHSITRASGGRLHAHIAGSSGDPLTALETDGIDAAIGNLSQSIAKAPELAFFSGLPGRLGVAPQVLNAWLEGFGGELQLHRTAAQFGAVAFLNGHTGATIGFWTQAEIDGLSDFTTRQMKTTGLGLAIADALSTAKSGTAATDIVEVIAQPTEAWAIFGSDRDNGDYHWYRDGFHQNGIASVLTIRAETWASLSDGDRELIKALAATALQQDLAQAQIHTRMVLPSLLASRGMKPQTLPRDVLHAIDHTSRRLIHDAATHNNQLRQVRDNYVEFQKAMTGASILSNDEPYLAPLG